MEYFLNAPSSVAKKLLDTSRNERMIESPLFPIVFLILLTITSCNTLDGEISTRNTTEISSNQNDSSFEDDYGKQVWLKYMRENFGKENIAQCYSFCRDMTVNLTTAVLSSTFSEACSEYISLEQRNKCDHVKAAKETVSQNREEIDTALRECRTTCDLM